MKEETKAASSTGKTKASRERAKHVLQCNVIMIKRVPDKRRKRIVGMEESLAHNPVQLAQVDVEVTDPILLAPVDKGRGLAAKSFDKMD